MQWLSLIHTLQNFLGDLHIVRNQGSIVDCPLMSHRLHVVSHGDAVNVEDNVICNSVYLLELLQ